MKTYKFTITIVGTGENDVEAWQDAYESFNLDSGRPPKDVQLIEDDDE